MVAEALGLSGLGIYQFDDFAGGPDQGSGQTPLSRFQVLDAARAAG